MKQKYSEAGRHSAIQLNYSNFMAKQTDTVFFKFIIKDKSINIQTDLVNLSTVLSFLVYRYFKILFLFYKSASHTIIES